MHTADFYKYIMHDTKVDLRKILVMKIYINILAHKLRKIFMILRTSNHYLPMETGR